MYPRTRWGQQDCLVCCQQNLTVGMDPLACSGNRLRSSGDGSLTVRCVISGLPMSWLGNTQLPSGTLLASYAVEAMGTCKWPQTGCLVAIDRLSQHTGDGDIGSCSMLLFRSVLSRRCLCFAPMLCVALSINIYHFEVHFCIHIIKVISKLFLGYF